jgi:hypothetical protein
MSGKGLLLKADPIAAEFHNEVKLSLGQASRRPRLVGILATSSAPSKFYAEFTKKQCEDLGVEFILKKTGAADTGDLGEGEGVEEAIIEANEDETVDGIMVRSIEDRAPSMLYSCKGLLSHFRPPAGGCHALVLKPFLFINSRLRTITSSRSASCVFRTRATHPSH